MSKGDRISNLPESLLHHILSFLHIKDVARSSVLSKRWNYIWTTVPVLDFQDPWYCPDTISSDTEKFMDFVDGTLHSHNSSNVDKFFLSWCSHLNESRVRSWISTVIRGNVKELKLYLTQDNPLLIPLSLFTCESLTSLELGARPYITFPKHISFPRLTRLRFWDVKINNESWNEELFTNSPVLEEFIMEYCIVSMENFYISIPTLKLLKIDTGTEEINGLRDCVFKIDTPSLVTFTYAGYAAKEFICSGFPALVKADILFYLEEDDGAAISRCLQALAHVKCLTVYDEFLQAICSSRDLSNNLLTFHNVKVLNVCYLHDVLNTDQEVIAFLKAVPIMESLVFDKGDDVEEEEEEEEEEDSDNAEGDGDDDSENDDADFVVGDNNHENQDHGNVSITAKSDSNDSGEDNNDKGDDSWEPDSAVTGRLFPRLKSVYFRRFVGNPREMRWVKLILRNAKTLQMMTIRYDDSHSSSVIVKSVKELMIEMPSFPKASADVVIKFCS